MTSNRINLSSLGLLLWSLLLCIGWLLPVHNRPWTAFHIDAWIALFLLIATGVVIARSRASVNVHGVVVLVAGLVGVIWLQRASGLVLETGNAWMGTIYLLGLLLALLAGACWESRQPGQLADALFTAIGIAAVVSVGIQLYQWQGGDNLWLWMMIGDSSRPFANLGQSNQMGTFLLWGLLALAWGVLRGKVATALALLLAAWLLFGLALTGSRTAWIAVVLLVAAAWLWRRHWPQPRFPWAVTGLALYFAACVAVVITLQQAAPTLDTVTRLQGEPRFAAWKLFADAVWQRPFFGYGWNQTLLAQGSVVLEHPPLSMFYSYSHNLFLDLVLWCGIPLGLLVAGLLLRWMWLQIRSVRSAEHAVLVLFVLVAANHAMFEYPLYYAYILLPVGLVMGALNVRAGMRPVWQMPRGIFALLWLSGAVLFALVVRDYFQVEARYSAPIPEAQDKSAAPSSDLLLLTQWQNYFEYSRLVPRAGMTEAELDRARMLTALNPIYIGFTFKLAMSLALNGKPQEAGDWLERFCRMSSKKHCESFKGEWVKAKQSRSDLASVAWPALPDAVKPE